jgi:NAD(P)-dependent dehydrogenase (short-subunit alcohol dehydrogenase family)
MTDSARERIAVIIGSGAMGLATARRFGPACRLLVADHSQVQLEAAVRCLADEGHRVDAMPVDVRDGSSVAAAAAARAAGTVTAIIYTAGVSPSQASTRDIFAIDLVGTAHVIDCFLDVVSPGTSLVCVASMSGYKRRLDPALESELATIPTNQLFDIRLFDLSTPDTGFAYSVAKRGVQLRVAAASLAWGRRGARVNSLSPGIICTPMSRQEFAGPRGDGMRSIVANLAVPRVGTPGWRPVTGRPTWPGYPKRRAPIRDDTPAHTPEPRGRHPPGKGRSGERVLLGAASERAVCDVDQAGRYRMADPDRGRRYVSGLARRRGVAVGFTERHYVAPASTDSRWRRFLPNFLPKEAAQQS